MRPSSLIIVLPSGKPGSVRGGKRLLNQSTHSRAANSTASNLSQGQQRWIVHPISTLPAHGRCTRRTGCYWSVSVSWRLIRPEKRADSAHRVAYTRVCDNPQYPLCWALSLYYRAFRPVPAPQRRARPDVDAERARLLEEPESQFDLLKVKRPEGEPPCR